MAPRGHTYRQNGLYTIMEVRTVTTRMTFFHANNQPAILLRPGLPASNMSPDNVPEGQIQEQ